MKIGVSSYSFAGYRNKTGAGYEEICTLARELGYEGIEFIRLEPSPGETEEDAADRIRIHCDRIGLPIIAYAVGADFLAHNPAEEVQSLCHCVDIARRLGAPLMRHDATQGEGCDDWRRAVREMAPYVREVTAYAAQRGIRTCTENHGYFIQDANRVEELILAVNHENYGWLVDVGNFACADEDSVHAVTIAAPYAFHVHAKDFLIKSASQKVPGAGGWFPSRHGTNLRGTVVGHGEIPLPRCMDILRAAGYDGWLSYEFEGPEEPLWALEQGARYLQALVESGSMA